MPSITFIKFELSTIQCNPSQRYLPLDHGFISLLKPYTLCCPSTFTAPGGHSVIGVTSTVMVAFPGALSSYLSVFLAGLLDLTPRARSGFSSSFLVPFSYLCFSLELFFCPGLKCCLGFGYTGFFEGSFPLVFIHTALFILFLAGLKLAFGFILSPSCSLLLPGYDLFPYLFSISAIPYCEFGHFRPISF